jgi:hypothetical protein
MPDNKRKRGKKDRRKVALNEAYELATVARKFKVRVGFVRYAIQVVGRDRREVEAFIQQVLYWVKR